MNKMILTAGIVVALSGPAFAIEPIPGSLTFPTQPLTKDTGSPVGSIASHTYHHNFGVTVSRSHRVEFNRSSKLMQQNRRER